MRTPEKLPANKGGQPARPSQPSATTPAAAARGPMTPDAVVTLQRAIGCQAMSGMLRDQHSEQGAATAQRAVRQNTGGIVQRMEDPARRRRQRRRSPGYEADVSSESSASSPERRGRLQDQIDQELSGGPDMGELVERLGRMEQPGFRRVRAIPEAEQAHPDQAGARYPVHHVSESSDDASASSSSEEHELPENEHLTELRELLMKELRRGEDRKKLKVTFKVIAPSNDVWGGHAWIEIRNSKGKKVSFGFYPTGGGDYQQIASVQGGVKCPDYMANRPETARETKEVRLKDIIRGYHLVHSRTESNYNFTLHNCTTFASDVWTAMTGNSLPRNWSALGLLGSVVSTPSGAAEGLGTRQERRHQTRRPRMHSLASGPARGVIPGGGTADEIAERMARAHISQSSSSQSEDVD
jgi:hypothetical protein